jgi:hypothetical protein
MRGKLKAWRTSLATYDLAIAAPSIKTALGTWATAHMLSAWSE